MTSFSATPLAPAELPADVIREILGHDLGPATLIAAASCCSAWARAAASLPRLKFLRDMRVGAVPDPDEAFATAVGFGPGYVQLAARDLGPRLDWDLMIHSTAIYARTPATVKCCLCEIDRLCQLYESVRRRVTTLRLMSMPWQPEYNMFHTVVIQHYELVFAELFGQYKPSTEAAEHWVAFVQCLCAARSYRASNKYAAWDTRVVLQICDRGITASLDKKWSHFVAFGTESVQAAE